MLRYVIYGLLGLLLGGVLGIVTPIALCALFVLVNPRSSTGVGTVFSMLWLITVPGGVGLGALIGIFIADWLERGSERPARDTPIAPSVSRNDRSDRPPQ
jgi:hypothetical protein